MRIAILSDIHGNDLALRAVLKEIEANGGADRYWILGDLVAIGPAPIQVLKTLQQLPEPIIIRGNTERYVCTGDRPTLTLDEAAADPALLRQLLEVEGDFSWTQGAVTAAGWFDWLSHLPLEHRDTLPDGTTVLCVHASPNRDDGSGIRQDLSRQQIEPLLEGCQEELLCVGHTHLPISMAVAGKQILNPGCVSNPIGQDVRAQYAMIIADEWGYELRFHAVDYDQSAVINVLERIRHPARRFISKHLRGEITFEPMA
jgi:putative phosphoesterase